jgi:hypothetical protein
MIEVVLSDLTGVVARAEGDCPECALIAARTLWDDMVGVPYAGKLTLQFVVAGRVVYASTNLEDVVRSLALAPAASL